MAFLERIGYTETVEQEQARLASAPAGSINRFLSTLPVTIIEWPLSMMIQLPWVAPRTERSYQVVVVPIDFHREAQPEGGGEGPLPRKRHSGSWACVVVSSDHPAYPVGGHRIIVSAAELARGEQIHLS